MFRGEVMRRGQEFAELLCSESVGGGQMFLRAKGDSQGWAVEVGKWSRALVDEDDCWGRAMGRKAVCSRITSAQPRAGGERFPSILGVFLSKLFQMASCFRAGFCSAAAPVSCCPAHHAPVCPKS